MKNRYFSLDFLKVQVPDFGAEGEAAKNKKTSSYIHRSRSKSQKAEGRVVNSKQNLNGKFPTPHDKNS
jgi:hypothetical protein